MALNLLYKFPKEGELLIKNNNNELVIKSFPIVTIGYGKIGEIIERTYKLNEIKSKEINSFNKEYSDYISKLTKSGKNINLK